MKRINLMKKIGWLVPVIMLGAYSCNESFLEQDQKGALGDAQTYTKKGAEQLLIGAYSQLKSSGWPASNTNWVFGSIVGGDAHKGSDGGDQSDINPIAAFTATPTNSYFDSKWTSVYDGINRCNATIKVVTKLTAAEISDADKKRIIGEARFLRGVYHFEAKKMWGNIPYIDENIDYLLNNYKVSNTVDAWPKIEADFLAAYNDLAEGGLEKGRANKWAAGAFLAKTYVYQKKWAQAKPVLDDIIAKGTTPTGVKYGLNTIFWDNFDAAKDNSKESVFAIQASVNDGSGAANGNADIVLNYPYNNGPGGCCGFFQPSFDLANSYRTDGSGLPLLDASFNNGANEVKSDQGLAIGDAFTPDAGNLDPRIDWTIGRRGLPYLDWGTHPGASWVRLQSNGGPYSPKKNAYLKSQEGTLTDGSSWTKGYTAANYNMIRFADVLLWAAECEAELSGGGGGSLSQALDYVNQVRARMQNQANWVKRSLNPSKSDWDAFVDPNVSSELAAKYVIGLYPSFPDKAYALKAIHMERKLELAMEGHRFFDLVRWGETTSTNAINNPVNLQGYLDYEGTKLSIYKGVKFVVGKHEYYPIPQNQIDLTNSGSGEGAVLKQNNGY